MIVWSGASFILRWSCLSRVNLSGVEPDRVKLTISSHVKCDPIPRVEYIWIRNTLTELVEINNNKRVLGPSQWKTINLKHTFPFPGQWFLFLNVFFCTSNVFEGINAKLQYPLKIVDLPTLQNDVLVHVSDEFCIQCNHDIWGLCRKLEELYWWHKSHHKRLPSYTTRPSHPNPTYTFLFFNPPSPPPPPPVT